MSSTCPFCGSETRPGDNFCLNCGNRLPSTPSPQQPQAQPGMGDSTIPAQDGWGQAPGALQPASQQAYQASTVLPSPPVASWIDPAAPTIASGGSTGQEPPTTLGSSGGAVQTASPAIEHPAKFILRADNGDVLQEYILDKEETTIGRAPNSDILLSKDKLTSRRHATVTYGNGEYTLHDERSANGTFVNGQQLDEAATHILQENDHIGIGEHELVFRSANSTASSAADNMFADMPTISVPYNAGQELTYRTREDELVTSLANDDYGTRSMDNGASDTSGASVSAVEPPSTLPVAPTPAAEEEQPVASMPMQNGAPAGFVQWTPAGQSNQTEQSGQSNQPNQSGQSVQPVQPVAPMQSFAQPPSSPVSNSQQPAVQPAYTSPSSSQSNENVTFSRLTSISQPTVPDIAPLMAALSTLDGQVMSLQQQLNATQDAVRNHESEVAQTSNQLRTGVRRVSERMDNTIADVARSREALAWADLLQLMEDVMNNPRDIEYVTKLARKARELNKVFQLHQSVLNTMAECNSLLRSLLGDDR